MQAPPAHQVCSTPTHEAWPGHPTPQPELEDASGVEMILHKATQPQAWHIVCRLRWRRLLTASTQAHAIASHTPRIRLCHWPTPFLCAPDTSRCQASSTDVLLLQQRRKQSCCSNLPAAASWQPVPALCPLPAAAARPTPCGLGCCDALLVGVLDAVLHLTPGASTHTHQRARGREGGRRRAQHVRHGGQNSLT